MRRVVLILVALVSLSLLAVTAGSAQPQFVPYTPDEMDELLAPIALYPDPLLAQILPAATFPDQIDAAQSCLQGRVDPALIDNQPWDVSVKSVAHYPDVLAMLHNDKEWAVAVGQAYACQQQAVFASTQRLRVRAYQAGNLVTTVQQRVVVTNDGTVLIVPAQAQQIYVPVYHPQEVYVARQPDHTDALIAFTVGLLIGSWLDRDVDWSHHCVYYHGWRGGGWIANSRRHIHFAPVYVNPHFGRTVVVNRDILRRTNPGFRSTVGRQAQLHRSVYHEGRSAGRRLRHRNLRRCPSPLGPNHQVP